MNSKNHLLEMANIDTFLSQILVWSGISALLFAASFLFAHSSPGLLASWFVLALFWLIMMVNYWRTGRPVLALIFGLSLGFGPYWVDVMFPMRGNAAWFQGYAFALLCITALLAVFRGPVSRFCDLDDSKNVARDTDGVASLADPARA